MLSSRGCRCQDYGVKLAAIGREHDVEDTMELRDELSRAWRGVLTGAVERGYPAGAVIETMASVAHERFSALFGPQAAASYLQLLAEQLRAADQTETDTLVRGDPEVDSSPRFGVGSESEDWRFDPDWQREEVPI